MKEKLLDHGLKFREAGNAQLEIVNITMRAELASKDKYNSRWRATYGYLVAISWLITFLGLVTALIITVIESPEHIGRAVNAMGDMMASSAVLWRLPLSVLGVTVSKRPRDKELVAGVTPSPGLFQAAISKIINLLVDNL